jgi:DNA repair protein RadC
MNNLFTFNEIGITYTSKGLGPRITSSRQIYDLLLPNWLDIDYVESFQVVMLNRNNRLIGVSKISVGSVGGTVADPKKIFQTALKANASGVVICHNHPSGSTTPSSNDKEVTKDCVSAGKVLRLPVLDHIILTRDSYFSFSDEGLI